MKILFNFLFWGEEKGGLVRAGSNMILALAKIIPDELFCVTNFPQLLTGQKNIKIIPYRFKNSVKILKAIEAQLFFRKILRQLGPDLLFNPFHFGYLGRFPNQITFIMDLIRLTVSKNRPISYLYFKFLLKKLAENSRFILVPSQATKNDLFQIYRLPPEKIIVVPLAVDEKIFVKKNLVKKDYFLIINASFPYKNVGFALECWRQFNVPEKLVIVGKNFHFPKYFEKLKKIAGEFGLEEKVVFYEKVSDEELVTLYNEAQALIFPSIKEGFGLPALEALACGTPVILSDIDVFKEYFAAIGIFFELNNAESFHQALQKFKDLNHQNFEAKRADFLKNFTWEKTAYNGVRFLRPLDVL